MESREELLSRLVRMDRPLGPILLKLAEFGWDSDRELVDVSRSDIKNALQSYVESLVSEGEIEAWANALESREDLRMSEAVREAIHVLANPLLTVLLSPELALKLIRRL